MSRPMGTLRDARRPRDRVHKIDGSGHRTRARADTESRHRRLGFDFGLGLNPTVLRLWIPGLCGESAVPVWAPHGVAIRQFFPLLLRNNDAVSALRFLDEQADRDPFGDG